MGSPLDRARRIVIKTGSALIAAKGAPRRDWIGGLAADIAALRAAGKEVVWVSSGAVALGRPHLGKGRARVKQLLFLPRHKGCESLSYELGARKLVFWA